MPVFKRKPLEGVFPITPLCLKENQEIDYEGIRWNIEWLEEKGIHGFIQLGCMGQHNAPSEEEFDKICDVCVDVSKDKKIACVVSSTATSTKEVIRRAKYAEDAGADGSMLALPYAFPVIDEWAVEFYQMVDDALEGKMAIMLYDFPPLTGFSISTYLWKEHLLNIKSIKAVKESNYNLHTHDSLVFTIADKVNVFPGSELPFYHDSLLGAKGMIGVLALVAPKVMLRFYEECKKGNQKSSWTLKAFKAIMDGDLSHGIHPGMVPMASYEHGYCNALAEIGGAKAGPPRKPYGRLPIEIRKRVEKALYPLMEMEREM